MRRLFYVALGATVGVLVVRRVTRTAQKLTPAGLAGAAGESVSELGASLRSFIDDVRAGMAEREVELEKALRADDAGSTRRSTDWNGR